MTHSMLFVLRMGVENTDHSLQMNVLMVPPAPSVPSCAFLGAVFVALVELS